MKTYNTVLTIAGSDSGGGAGIQADIKSISACGSYAASAITALTSQNTAGVTGIFPVSAEFVYKQIEAVLSDIGAKAVKTGMLFNREIIEIVSKAVDDFKIKNLVIDPVMVATSGDRLLQEDAVKSMLELLLTKAMVITPNIPEAEIILGKSISKHEVTGELSAAAIEMSEALNVAVLLKGGHSEENIASKKSVDILKIPNQEIKYFESSLINTKNTHGTGCSLSASIAAYLAQDMPIEKAVSSAKLYLSRAIEYGADFEIGKGHGPVHHFWDFY